MKPRTRPYVLVTGFGPFGPHKVNASSEAVRTIRSMNLWTDTEVDLVTEEIPVSYDFVQRGDIWRRDNPNLVALVHCGVSHLATKLTIETVAHNCGYISKDVDGCCPADTRCCVDGEEKLSTVFDADKIVDKVNSSGQLTGGVEAETSSNAGRYLCEFSFYRALWATDGKAIFVHVPQLDQPYSKVQLAKGIVVVASEVVSQAKNMK